MILNQGHKNPSASKLQLCALELHSCAQGFLSKQYSSFLGSVLSILRATIRSRIVGTDDEALAAAVALPLMQSPLPPLPFLLLLLPFLLSLLILAPPLLLCKHYASVEAISPFITPILKVYMLCS